jgi:hypothetical protein
LPHGLPPRNKVLFDDRRGLDINAAVGAYLLLLLWRKFGLH